jgi:DnaJ like chaperone protein
VLGVQPSATKDEISAAYKRKISEYHPDKVTRMGKEIRELAEQRSKEINAAYEEALRRFR